LVKAIK